MELTNDQLRTLRHMLGIDDPWMRRPVPTRDYYCANPARPDRTSSTYGARTASIPTA